MRNAGWIAVLALTGCGHAPTALPVIVPVDLAEVTGDPTSCAGEPSSWVERAVADRDAVTFSAGLEADADRIDDAIGGARALLSVELGVPSDATLPAHVWLVTHSPTLTPPDGAPRSLNRWETGASIWATPSPSCAADGTVARDVEGALTTHLARSYLMAATAATETGWSYPSAAPAWFREGAPAWVARAVAVEDGARAEAERDAAMASPDGAIAASDTGPAVASPARDGAALVAWLELTHGVDVVQRLAASDAPTFEAALTEVTALDPAGLAAAYLAWRAGAR